VPCVSTHLPSFDAWIVKVSIFPQSTKKRSDSGHKALRASAIFAFVNVMDETGLMRLDAGKMHL